MFVRIIRENHDTIMQCDQVRISSDGPDESKFILSCEYGADKNVIDHEIDTKVPGVLGVYLMNDHGRTIDTVFRKDAN